MNDAKLKRFDRSVIGIDGRWFVIIDELEAEEPRKSAWILNGKESGEILGKRATVRNGEVAFRRTPQPSAEVLGIACRRPS